MTFYCLIERCHIHFLHLQTEVTVQSTKRETNPGAPTSNNPCRLNVQAEGFGAFHFRIILKFQHISVTNFLLLFITPPAPLYKHIHYHNHVWFGIGVQACRSNTQCPLVLQGHYGGRSAGSTPSHLDLQTSAHCYQTALYSSLCQATQSQLL